MSLVLAIDQSTSATKALLLDEDGRTVASACREHAQHYPRPGWVEHDPDEIWARTLEVSHDALTGGGSLAARVRGISISNQRETVVPFRRSTGRPLHRAVVWQDRRGDGLCRELQAAGHEPAVRRITGLTLDAYFSASKMRWLLEHVPEVRDAADAGDLALGTVDTWLIHRMTGGRSFATDVTNASRTLLLDAQRLGWSAELADLFGVPEHALPEVRASSDVFGETTLEGALPAAVPVCGVLGDQQAALLAEGCIEPGQAKATFGTGCFILLNVGPAPTPAPHGLVTTVAWRLGERTRYAFEGVIQSAGSAVTWLRDQLGLIRSSAETEDLAAGVPDTGGVYLVPAFTGLGAPHWAASARAALVGLTQHTDKRHVARATLESVAYQVRDVLETMAEAGVPLTEVRADGGMVRNALLMQLVADITRVPVRASLEADLTPRGAALACLLGLGVRGSIADIAAVAPAARVFEPAMPAARADELYAGWRAAVQRVL